MSIIEELLKIDLKEFKEEEFLDLELKRLSKKLGKPFIIKVKALSEKELKEVKKNSEKRLKTGGVQLDEISFINQICINSIVEPCLTDERLLSHYGCNSAEELISILLNFSEKDSISLKVLEFSGLIDDEIEGTIKEVKKK